LIDAELPSKQTVIKTQPRVHPLVVTTSCVLSY